MKPADDPTLEVIRSDGNMTPLAVSNEGWVPRVDITRKYAGQRCRALAHRGLLRCLDKGLYGITDEGLRYLAFGLAYPFVGGIKDSRGTRYQIAPLSELATLEGLNDLLLNVYFSEITFSTIGYGDLSPAAPGTRALVFVESLIGAVLVALLVFVLGRRVAR